MPPFGEIEAKGDGLMRTLIYGPAKSKKTWWAARAAEAGFNVFLINGETGGEKIIKNIAPEIRKHIQVLNVVNMPNRAVMPEFMASFLRQNKFAWDEQLNQPRTSAGQIDATHSHYLINGKLLTADDVLIIDSYTQLAIGTSLKGAIDGQIDLSDPNSIDDDKRGFYGYSNSFLNWVLNNLNALPCHLIVIGHQNQYEKRGKVGDKEVILWSRMQLMSSSGPHAMQIAKYFSDVLYFYMVGDIYRISTKAEADRDGGSRNIKPGVFKWDELQFVDLCKAADVRLPINHNATKHAPPSAGIKWYPAGVEIEEMKKAPPVTIGSKAADANAPIIADATAVVKVEGVKPKMGGLSSLLNKNK